MTTPAVVDTATIIPATAEPTSAVATAQPSSQTPTPEPQPAAAVKTPEPRPSPVDTEREAEKAELAYYRREAAKGELQAKAATYRAQLEADGWPTELAAIQTQTWLEKETATSELVAAEARRENYARHEVARRLAERFGGSQESLLVYQDPYEMLAAAQRLGGEARRIAALEAEVKALRGGTVPAQTFDNGQGASAASDKAFLDLYSEWKSNDHVRAKKLLGM